MRLDIRYILLTILLLIGFNVQALTMTPFNVRYHVYRGNIHVANSTFSLQKEQSEWVWLMSTRPRGIYSWLTRKKPFSETRMLDNPHEPLLLLEKTGDYPKKPAKRNTWFDHPHKTIYSMNGKKINTIDLVGDVYNYHSIHLLYPKMLEQHQAEITVSFYKRGKLLESTLTLEEQVILPSKKESTVVDKVTQTFKDSNKKMIYYYQGNLVAPLKIEQVKPGKDTSVMWRVDTP